MSHLGSMVHWLRENMGTIEDVSEVEVLVAQMNSNNSFLLLPGVDKIIFSVLDLDT